MMNTVVLVHGLTHNPGRMAYMARYLTRGGWKVLNPALTPSNGSVSLEALADMLAAFIKANTSGNERIDIVGFSMGGLVCRYYLQCLDGAAKADRFVSISAPHHGTQMANLFKAPGIRQMRPGSDFLRKLNANVSQLERVACTVLYTPLDLIIIPAKSSILPFAQVSRFMMPAHPLMIYSPRVFKKLAEILSADIKPEGGSL